MASSPRLLSLFVPAAGVVTTTGYVAHASLPSSDARLAVVGTLILVGNAFGWLVALDFEAVSSGRPRSHAGELPYPTRSRRTPTLLLALVVLGTFTAAGGAPLFAALAEFTGPLLSVLGVGVFPTVVVVVFSLTPFVVMIDGRKPFESLGRSITLTEGYRRGVFLLLVPFDLLSIVVQPLARGASPLELVASSVAVLFVAGVRRVALTGAYLGLAERHDDHPARSVVETDEEFERTVAKLDDAIRDRPDPLARPQRLRSPECGFGCVDPGHEARGG